MLSVRGVDILTEGVVLSALGGDARRGNLLRVSIKNADLTKYVAIFIVFNDFTLIL
jgi:hypothetical protein